MSATRGSVKRATVGSGDDFSVFQRPSMVDGTTLTTERVALQWAPLQVVKIADDVNNAGAGDFPSRGSVTISTATAVGSGTQTITLSGALPAGSAVGLLLLLLDVTSAANKYQVFKIIGQSGNVLSLNKYLPASLTLPADNAKFSLLIDCEDFNLLTVKPEFSLVGNTCQIIPAFYAGIRTLDEPTATVRAPYRINDRALDVDNLGFQGDTEETSYYHGVAQTVSCIGALGAKVRIASVTGGGTVSLWAATA